MEPKKKLEKMVANYNKSAIKHGYPTIEVDYVNKKVIGEFVPKDEHAHTGFWGYWKDVLTAGMNGSMVADLGRIRKLVEEI